MGDPAITAGAAMARGRSTDGGDDTAGTLLAEARVAGALFGPAAGTVLGRFHILERLGAGGMGVVHAAYDPELDRGVALKLVHVPGAARAAALAEAKALAKLSHPNVVPIYDVGTAGEHVYLVMELVRGETLGRWAAGRRRRELLDAYQQAGAALAAAHRAGLVHRDFKPDNALVGRDGRVRVVDFGLACEAEEPAGETTPQAAAPRRIVGTPRYMAPEQARGGAVTAAADQYSFSVALGEALAACAEQPVPRWLAAVVERGRAAEPAARFPSLAALLRALARDPARARRRWLAAGGVAAAVAAVGFVVGRHAGGDAGAGAPIEVCAGAADELARAWSPDARAAALARLDGLGAYGRSVRATIAPHLDAHDARWLAGRRDACLAHRNGLQSTALFDQRTACLARGLAALGAVGQIAGSATTATLAEVPRAVLALPDPAACGDLAAIATGAAPPPVAIAPAVRALAGRLAEARVVLGAGRATEARAAAGRAVAEARPLGHAPLLAEALVVEGHAALAASRRDAERLLAEAQGLAIVAGDDALAIEAWARRAWALGTLGDPGALAGLELVEALGRRPGASAFARALLYNNLGSIALARSDRARARAALETARGLAEGVTGPGALELVAIRTNLALVATDPARARAYLDEAVALLATRLGADHPDTLDARWLHAVTLDTTAAAAAALEPVCRATELHADRAGSAAECWAELGFLAVELGDLARAVVCAERVLATRPGVARPEDAAALAYARGDRAGAVAGYREALARSPQLQPTAWWRRYARADALVALARAQHDLGAVAEARRALDEAVPMLEEILRDHPNAAYERRRVRALALRGR